MSDRQPGQPVRLLLRGRPGVRYRSAPVTFGVPFAEGALERGRPVLVTELDGTPLPTQARCLATWRKDLRHVKWLLLDFAADLDESGERELRLVTDSRAASPAPAEPVRLERRGGLIEVSTGPMALQLRSSFEPWVRPDDPGLFGRCLVRAGNGAALEWHDLSGGGPGIVLSLKDQRGRRYSSFPHGPAPVVEIEEQGPLRACVKVTGHHSMERGPRMCPYVLRLHFFAGRADIRIRHTFVFDQDPREVSLAAVGVELPLDLGQGLRAAVGGSRQPHAASALGSLRFLQQDDSHYTVSRDGEPFGEGERTDGWASLGGSLGGAVAVVRNCWQEYPKGLTVTSCGIHVGIWPEEAPEPLDFRTPWAEPAAFLDGRPAASRPIRDEAELVRVLREQPTAPLNLKSIAVKDMAELAWVETMLERHAPGRVVSYNDTGTSDGTGAAKTTEIHLRLAGGPIADAEAEALAREVQSPLMAPAAPEHMAATGVAGQFYHAGDPRFAEVDLALDGLLRVTVTEPRETCRVYGMMRYGNVLCGHGRAGPGLAYRYYRDRDPRKVLERVGLFNNEANDLVMGIWGNFLRTGTREHFCLANDYGMAVADVATVHAHPRRPDEVGLMHYHNAHQWSGGPSASHTLLTGLLFGYYFTGDRRILDVACEAADNAVRTQEPAGILSCRHGVLHREFTGPLWSLMEAYRATWREDYGELASRSLAWFLRSIPAPGMYPNSVFTRGERGDEAVVQGPCTPPQSATEKYYLFRMGMELFPSSVLERQITADADYWVWEGAEDAASWYVTMACLAYELTGDLTYAAYCRTRLPHFLGATGPSLARTHMNFGDVGVGSVIPRLMRVVADAESRDPAALDQAEAAWREKRRNMVAPPDPERPDKGPERSLGVLSTDPLR